MGLCISLEGNYGPPRKDKLRGCFYGLAVGDALGTTLEFQKRDSSIVIKDMMGGGPHDLLPGFWTDDTSMALCIAESLCVKRAFDARDQMTRYLSWYETGHLGSTGDCFDIGMTIHGALSAFKVGQDNPYRGKTWEKSAGNGSLMRLAPIPMFFHRSVLDAVTHAELSSKTTHGAPQCISAVQYYTVLLIGALMGAQKESLLSSLYTGPYGNVDLWDRFKLHPEILTIAEGSYKTKRRDEIKSSAYVVHSLEAALWAFYNASTYEEGALLSANLGGDADTVCAIYGMLAGAFWGFSSIPARWISVLAFRPVLALFCNSIILLSTENKPLPDFEYHHKVLLGAEVNYRNLIFDRVKPGPRRFKSLPEFEKAIASFELSSFGKLEDVKGDFFASELREAYRILLSAARKSLEKVFAKKKLGVAGMFADIRKKKGSNNAKIKIKPNVMEKKSLE